MSGVSELLAYTSAVVALVGIALSLTLRKMTTAQISRQLQRVTGHYDETVTGSLFNRVGTRIGRKTVRGDSAIQALSKLLRAAGIYSLGAPYIFAAIQVTGAIVASVCVMAWAIHA